MPSGHGDSSSSATSSCRSSAAPGEREATSSIAHSASTRDGSPARGYSAAPAITAASRQLSMVAAVAQGSTAKDSLGHG